MESVANTKDLEAIITAQLKPCGFRKKGSNWYLNTDDCVRMINLQKSEWGGQYYLNTAILVTSLDKEQNPLEYKCHIRVRADFLVPDKAELSKVLDLENHSVPSKKRAEFIAGIISDYLIPFLLSLGTLDSIKEAVLENDIVSCRTTLALKRFLFPEKEWV